MFNLLYRGLLFTSIGILTVSSFAQNLPAANPWHALDRLPQDQPAANHWIATSPFKAFKLDTQALREALAQAPQERFQPVGFSAAILSLPMPDGTLARFRFVESRVMAPELAAQFPEIKTYLGQGIDDPLATVRFDLTPAGFHAQILSPRGAVYVDPYFRGNSAIHSSYFKRDYRRAAEGFVCLTGEEPFPAAALGMGAMALSGEQLRTYRLACAATGEYTQFHGGTVPAALAAMVTAINRVSGVYERELAIRLELVPNNQLLIYTSGNMDPYNNTSGSSMLGQNQANIDDVIGSGNYDIGHVFSTGGGGIASLGCVCVNGRKAYGVTGLPSPNGDAFYIDYVAHEMGHQFGANHSFNSVTGNCGGGNRNPATAYEPGSGSTIMAYAGICGADDLQPHSDPYFHSVSLDEIIAFTTAGAGSSCAVLTPTGNQPPTVLAGPNFTIPRGTPFMLTASATDPDGDALTYCWEERDLGSAITLTAADNGFSPLFRSFNPTTSPSRTFPKLADILSNSTTLGEKLPTTTRTLNFRVVARDNQPAGGGIHTANMQVQVSSGSGPFVVTSPNSAVTWSNVQTIAWNVANTTASPINASHVNILLSIDGGSSWPFVLATNVPNDGAHAVFLPNLVTSTARVKVQAASNIFFDISDVNFSIIESVPAPALIVESTVLQSESCPNGAIDPFETVTLQFLLRNIGLASTTNLVVSLLSTNGLIVQSLPQTLGVLAAGGGAATVPVTFNASGSCGAALSARLQFQDGLTTLGSLVQPLTLGTAIVSTTTWSNPIPIAIPAPGDTRGNASPYPSAIEVSGITGVVDKVEVTLHGLSHSASDDVDILLVAPSGQSVMLMSDAGNGGAINNATLSFADAAASSLSGGGTLTSGTFKPTNFDGNSDDFAGPAPAGNYAATLASLKGTNPNGAWSLYVQDDFKQNSGTLQGGWTLRVTSSNQTCCATTPPQSDLAIGGSGPGAAVQAGNPLSFSLRITNLGPATASSVTITDALPTGVTMVLATSSQGSHVVDGALVCFALGSLTNGETATIDLLVEASLPGSITNRAWVTAANPDPVAANNYLALSATVLASNHPPALQPIADRWVHAGSLLLITNLANDPDLPINTLSFTLAPGAPAGATISAEGILQWQTGATDANTTNDFTVKVTDDGTPNLSDEESFTVTVIQPPLIQSIAVSNSIITLTWEAIAGQKYQVQYQEMLGDTTWVTLPGVITANGNPATTTDTLMPAARFYRILALP